MSKSEFEFLAVPFYFLTLNVSSLSKLLLAQFVETSNTNIDYSYSELEKVLNASQARLRTAFRELKELNLISVSEFLCTRSSKYFNIKVNFKRLEEVRQLALEKHSFFTKDNVDQCLSVPKFAIRAVYQLDTVIVAAFLMLFDDYCMRTDSVAATVGTSSYLVRKVLHVAQDVDIMRRVKNKTKWQKQFKIDRCHDKQQVFFSDLIARDHRSKKKNRTKTERLN